MSGAKQPCNSEELERLREAFLATGAARPVLEGRAALVDRLVRDVFLQSVKPSFPGEIALLAVGGYGRRELFPHSDVDLLLLVDRAAQTEEAREVLSNFFRILWDSKLRISHSLRTPQECSELHEQNIELNISLLDRRFLAGDASLFERLEARMPSFVKSHRASLERYLVRMARSRHGKFQNSIYHMEPQLKEAPGGIRDLQLVSWLSTTNSLPEDLYPARDFLYAVRCRLHYAMQRDANVLSFDLQEDMAEQGFLGLRDPETLMRTYFRHARSVHAAALRRMEAIESASSGLLSQFRDWRSRLSNSEFTVLQERVYLRSHHVLESDPDVALRLFEFLARHGLRLSTEAERRIGEALLSLAAHFSKPRNIWPQLRTALALPHAALALRAFADTGLLRAILPEWEAIDCLVVRDFYHRYTVDEHTLVAIQNLSDLREAKDRARQRFRELLEETEDQGLLRFALLLHDIGKGARTGSHAIESVRLADAIMSRIGVPDAEQKTIRFLIERHLELSSLMTTRDLEDSATGLYLSRRVETIEQLKLLTLLTYADVSAVNPSAMTPWRLEQLWRVFRLGRRALTRALEDDRIAGPDLELDSDFLTGLPTRYLRTRSKEEIESDLKLYQRCRAVGVAIDLQRSEAFWRLTLAAPDRPGLFASAAGVLAAFGMNILKAEAFGNRAGIALDTFVFSDPSRTLELNPGEVSALRSTMEQAAQGLVDIARLLTRRPLPVRPSRGSRISPSVSIYNDESETATLVEVVAEDRPGLLYQLASTLSDEGYNIDVVLIDTEAHKALDVFYVTAGGSKVASGDHERLRQRLMEVCSP